MYDWLTKGVRVQILSTAILCEKNYDGWCMCNACIDLKINLHFSLMIDSYCNYLFCFQSLVYIWHFWKTQYIFFPLLFIKTFTISIEHSFPFNWSLWLFLLFCRNGYYGVVWAILELEVLDFKAWSKKEYFRRQSVDHFCDEAGWAFGILTDHKQVEEGFVTNEV